MCLLVLSSNAKIQHIHTNMYVFGHYTDQKSIYTYFISISMVLKIKLKGEGGSISEYAE